jgi:hypothetical protein
MAVGGIFGLSASSSWSDAQEHCRGTLCDQQGVDLRNDAASSATWSTVLFIVGTAATAAGAVLVLTTPKNSKDGGIRLAPLASPGGAGLSAGGLF